MRWRQSISIQSTLHCSPPWLPSEALQGHYSVAGLAKTHRGDGCFYSSKSDLSLEQSKLGLKQCSNRHDHYNPTVYYHPEELSLPRRRVIQSSLTSATIFTIFTSQARPFGGFPTAECIIASRHRTIRSGHTVWLEIRNRDLSLGGLGATLDSLHVERTPCYRRKAESRANISMALPS